MNTKVSPLLNGGIAAILAAGVTIGALALTGNISFSSDNSQSVGSQGTRAAAVYTNNLYVNSGSSTVFKIGDAGSQLDFVATATTTVNVDSIAPGQTTTTNITVTGAAIGDMVNVNRVSGDLFSSTTTFSFISWVSAANTVTLSMRNATSSGAMNAGSSVIRATVLSPLVP